MTGTAQSNALGYFSPLAVSRHCLLTTYKKVGTPVATPVYLAVEADVAYFRTYDASGKAKRLRHTSRVELQPCDFRGKTKDGETVAAVATLLEGEEDQHAKAQLNRQHPLALGIVVPRIHKLRGWKTHHYRLD
ncbi:MAG TPA: PPOX class F420-dependent oxidoreductase, partial [Acidimicrobiales bacterium]|nr:PPOX class F420-dependent oxidoreductase [Acidimicrobiales bacterium]